MECPKCGAIQENGREECASCGIIFARWQPRPQRTPTMERRFTFSEPAPKVPSIPWPFIVIGVVFAVILGLMWTKHYKAAKAAENPDDILNEINNKGVKQRERLRQEQMAMARAARSQTPRATGVVYPRDFNESAARELLETCSYFQTPVSFEIPRQFQKNMYRLMADRYPALAGAEREHLIEFDPPLPAEARSDRPDFTMSSENIAVKLTPYASAKVDATDRGGDTFQFGIGRRRVEAITAAALTSESEMGIGFTWTYEKPTGNAIAPDYQHHTGGAQLQRTSTGWTVSRAWINSHTASTVVCP